MGAFYDLCDVRHHIYDMPSCVKSFGVEGNCKKLFGFCEMFCN